MFLIEDRRPKTPDIGISRYLISGIWSGLFRFQGGRMVLNAGEQDKLRSEYVGQTKGRIVSEVMAALK